MSGSLLMATRSFTFPALIVRQLIREVEAIQPCLGVSKEHLDEGAAQGFPSVVRTAERALEDVGFLSFEGVLQWASGVNVMGFLAGRTGVVSGVLGMVANRRVFWSKACTGVATTGYGDQSIPRCSSCRGFHRDTLLKRAYTASREQPHPKTNNSLLSTAQKVRASFMYPFTYPTDFISWKPFFVIFFGSYCQLRARKAVHCTMKPYTYSACHNDE